MPRGGEERKWALALSLWSGFPRIFRLGLIDVADQGRAEVRPTTRPLGGKRLLLRPGGPGVGSLSSPHLSVHQCFCARPTRFWRDLRSLA
jgi:hypothetical protein